MHAYFIFTYFISKKKKKKQHIEILNSLGRSFNLLKVYCLHVTPFLMDIE